MGSYQESSSCCFQDCRHYSGEGSMASKKRVIRPTPWIFFLLLFLITIPEYVIGLVPPCSILMVINPFIAASLLTCRENGSDGIMLFLRRSFDFRRIRRRIWYLPIIFLMPMAILVSFGWMIATGASSENLQVPAMIAVLFLVFFIAAIGEELGWSGYALEPLQDRWGALPAAIIIGMVWALWHLVPYALANPMAWVAGQCLATVMIRVLMVWIFNNTGKSVFGMILFHAMVNLCTVPDYGLPYDPVILGMILTVIAAAVVYLWGPGTLARYRGA